MTGRVFFRPGSAPDRPGEMSFEIVRLPPVKPRLQLHRGAWWCWSELPRCNGTIAGRGLTPRAAFDDWLRFEEHYRQGISIVHQLGAGPATRYGVRAMIGEV